MVPIFVSYSLQKVSYNWQKRRNKVFRSRISFLVLHLAMKFSDRETIMGSLRYIFTVVKTPVPCISTSCTLCFYYVTKCAKIERRSCYITTKMTKIIFLSPATTRSETCVTFQVSSAVFVQLFCFVTKR